MQAENNIYVMGIFGGSIVTGVIYDGIMVAILIFKKIGDQFCMRNLEYQIVMSWRI